MKLLNPILIEINAKFQKNKLPICSVDKILMKRV